MRRPTRIEPGPGQESVWDYPRPPRLERTDAHLRVEFAGEVIAETSSAFRVLETSQPPAFYLPPGDVAMSLLRESAGASWCEWKGSATYFDIVVGGRVATSAAWTYRSPNTEFADLQDHVAFYPQSVDSCFVDGERVEANEGGFYGGWITSKVVGPFKGGAGSMGW